MGGSENYRVLVGVSSSGFYTLTLCPNLIDLDLLFSVNLNGEGRCNVVTAAALAPVTWTQGLRRLSGAHEGMSHVVKADNESSLRRCQQSLTSLLPRLLARGRSCAIPTLHLMMPESSTFCVATANHMTMA
ncbi:hypothetical protein PAXRUDRAFT_157981 [Paxillus rubicundulus Ve08.2h10]|uniref:Uncharacterized protein n=1 Tax=Paxillus rubicundulus Ve08.2h10 TaxID=930991 RepID=A0A0D0CYH6_9AGAM|nr:hypothetical protein PAXRUDRAFT_157981 [Paxillus rubicundulus Ve08.2h10]